MNNAWASISLAKVYLFILVCFVLFSSYLLDIMGVSLGQPYCWASLLKLVKSRGSAGLIHSDKAVEPVSEAFSPPKKCFAWSCFLE